MDWETLPDRAHSHRMAGRIVRDLVALPDREHSHRMDGRIVKGGWVALPE